MSAPPSAKDRGRAGELPEKHEGPGVHRGQTPGPPLAAARLPPPRSTCKTIVAHPGWSRHRLKRYEELTGADLAETEDAFCVWWALQREEVGHDGDAATRLAAQ